MTPKLIWAPDHIFLDIDGVCVDWARAAIKAHGSTEKFEQEDLRPELQDTLGCTQSELWKCIDDAGEAFWADMPPLPWYGELYQLLSMVAPVTFVTSPSWHHSSASGKVQWLQKRFGKEFRDFLIGYNKALLAGPNRLLVDDTPRNTKAFIAAGGKALLFPSPANPLNPIVAEGKEAVMAHVRRELRSLLYGPKA